MAATGNESLLSALQFFAFCAQQPGVAERELIHIPQNIRAVRDEISIDTGGNYEAGRHREAMLSQDRKVRAFAAAQLKLNSGRISKGKRAVHWVVGVAVVRSARVVCAGTFKPDLGR